MYKHPKLDQIRGNPDLLLDVFEEFTNANGSMMDVGRGKGHKINAYIMEAKPTVMAEFGVYYGFSAILFASAMRKASPGKQLKYWSLEYNPVFAAISMNLIDLAGLSDIVTVVTGPATDSLARLKKEGKVNQLDMLFIDHWKDLYLPDVKTVEAMGVLHSGSYIIADNTSTAGAQNYLEYMRNHSGWESTPLASPGRDGQDRVRHHPTSRR